MTAIEPPPSWREMVAGQTAFVVDHWGGSSSGDMSMVDRETGDLTEAHVVSSKVRLDLLNLHKVVLDIDHVAHLLPSSTPGHSHLYVDIPPVSWEDYEAFLRAAAKIGLIEPGYSDASRRRGHSDVRLPWIQKDSTDDFSPKRPLLRCSGCKNMPHEIDEYVVSAMGEGTEEVPDSEVWEFVWQNEGTLNRETGYFACTECYIKMGMPSSDGGWTAAGPVPKPATEPARSNGPLSVF